MPLPSAMTFLAPVPQPPAARERYLAWTQLVWVLRQPDQKRVGAAEAVLPVAPPPARPRFGPVLWLPDCVICGGGTTAR